jgi:hypothetical protein
MGMAYESEARGIQSDIQPHQRGMRDCAVCPASLDRCSRGGVRGRINGGGLRDPRGSHRPDNRLGIAEADLTTKANPKGRGIFVYVPQERIGSEGHRIWMVTGDQAFPLNARAKDLTPSLPWPREARPGVWEATGLNPYSPTEAFEIVFGRE